MIGVDVGRVAIGVELDGQAVGDPGIAQTATTAAADCSRSRSTILQHKRQAVGSGSSLTVTDPKAKIRLEGGVAIDHQGAIKERAAQSTKPWRQFQRIATASSRSVGHQAVDVREIGKIG